MVDTGFSPKETRARLRHLNLDLSDISAILVTHAHGDHVKSVKQLAGSLGIKTWATEATKRFASTFTSFANHAVVEPGERFSIGGLSILPVKTCHDEPGSVAYAITDGDEAFAICTDLGDPSEAVGAGLRDVDTLMLEFNHDRVMLQNGPYHARLKRRVASKYGHLNNDDAATLLRHAVTPNLSRLLCAHLSEVNNTPTKALAAARTVVDGMDVDVAVAPQHSPTNWLRVRCRGPVGEVVDVKQVINARVVDKTAPPPAPAPARATRPSSPAPAPAPAAPAAPAAQPASSSAVMALREAVTRRQLALFGGPTVSTTEKITSSIASTTHRLTKERR